VVDDSDPEVESDLRRRAAWLLLMLVVVAVLLVVVISALVSTNDSGSGNAGPGPLDPVATESGQQSPSASHSTHHRRHHHQHPSGSESSTGTSSIPVGTTSCPTSQTCIIEGDPGNSIQAINDFRTAHGLPAVPGSVTTLAQTCAVNNGNGCTGGWAETELAQPNGDEAVQRIEQFAHFEDPHLTSVEVGWAYDPSAKLYYFAIVRND
jgi:hypothetical protein